MPRGPSAGERSPCTPPRPAAAGTAATRLIDRRALQRQRALLLLHRRATKLYNRKAQLLRQLADSGAPDGGTEPRPTAAGKKATVPIRLRDAMSQQRRQSSAPPSTAWRAEGGGAGAKPPRGVSAEMLALYEHVM